MSLPARPEAARALRVPNQNSNGDTDTLLVDDDQVIIVHDSPRQSRSVRWRGWFIRSLALLCACSLSVGSHYATYILAPLKSRISREMGTSNTEFSLLLAAFSLNSTWTPLAGGVLAATLGTTFTSILATGIIVTGLFVLLVGDLTGDVRLMTLGMFIFGLGVSPLAVVQETIIVRFFKSHSLGLSMAIGLVAGKIASFVAARTSYPLTQKFGPHAPFYTAAILATFSFGINLVYVASSKWLVANTQTELEPSEIRDEAARFSVQDMSEGDALAKVAEKRRVKLKDITQLGDVFWAYIGVNLFCGMIWHPFTHLAANLIQRRYQLTELDASTKASYLLAGSMFLYPTVGFVIDRFKRPSLVIMLFALSSLLTMFGYTWFTLPPEVTGTPVPAIASIGAGIGFSPLLLVVIVPQLVPMRYVSTTLGAHKSLEQAGATISQTLSGLILDSEADSDPNSTQPILSFFLVLNVIQFLGILGLWYLSRRQRLKEARHRHELIMASPNHSETSLEDDANARESSLPHSPRRTTTRLDTPSSENGRSKRQRKAEKRMKRRGKVFGAICAGCIVGAWVLFLVTAYLRLRSKREREGKLHQ